MTYGMVNALLGIMDNTMLALMITATVTFGCVPQVHPRAGQDDATAIVWSYVYGEENAPPPIEWVPKKDLNCADGTGFYDQDYPGGPQDGICVLGNFFPGYYFIRVALISPTTHFYDTSFAHELLHAHLQHKYGDPDGKHSRIEWQYGQLKDQANAELEAAGL